MKKNLSHPCPIEIKHTRGKGRFYLREIKDHQLYALLACESETGFTFKIPDMGFGYLPFDMFFFKNTPSYVCILFDTKKFYFIRPQLIQDIKESGTPSITQEEAARIATLAGSL